MLLLLVLTGCATEVGNFTRIGSASFPAKPANHPIDVFTNGVPARPYERIAILDAHCEAQMWQKPNLANDGLPTLIKQARAAGCDAIIEIQERRVDNWTLETGVSHFTATGVAYTNRSP